MSLLKEDCSVIEKVFAPLKSNFMSLSKQNTARLAGIYYLIIAITGFYGIMYVPSKIMVKGDAAATMSNLLANEFLFRTGTVANLIDAIAFIFLVLSLHRLFKPVNENQAKLMLIFVLVQIPIFFLAEAFNISALMIAKGELMKSIDITQRQDMVMLFLKTYDYGQMLLATFWGLWLIPFGILMYQSGFMPRLLGILLILGGIGYILEVLTYLLLPDFRLLLSNITMPLYSLAEIGTLLWLLIKGVHEKTTPSV
jgi:hypothetical protein